MVVEQLCCEKPSFSPLWKNNAHWKWLCFMYIVWLWQWPKIMSLSLLLETAISIIRVFASLQNRTHTCDALFNMRMLPFVWVWPPASLFNYKQALNNFLNDLALVKGFSSVFTSLFRLQKQRILGWGVWLPAIRTAVFPIKKKKFLYWSMCFFRS